MFHLMSWKSYEMLLLLLRACGALALIASCFIPSYVYYEFPDKQYSLFGFFEASQNHTDATFGIALLLALALLAIASVIKQLALLTKLVSLLLLPVFILIIFNLTSIGNSSTLEFEMLSAGCLSLLMWGLGWSQIRKGQISTFLMLVAESGLATIFCLWLCKEFGIQMGYYLWLAGGMCIFLSGVLALLPLLYERPWLFSIVCGMIAQFGLILVTSCIDRTSFLNDILIGWSFMLFAYPLQAILNNIEGGPVIGLFIELLMSTFTVFVYGLIIYALLKVVKKIKGKYINY